MLGKTAIDASFNGINIRSTDLYINGREVFLSSDGAFLDFNGEKHENVNGYGDFGKT